jgi:hypothetical protein
MTQFENVEVFRTDVQSSESARQIIEGLSSVMEEARITFDLEDVDRILRIASARQINTTLVETIVGLSGHCAEVLGDTVPEPLAKVMFTWHSPRRPMIVTQVD